LTYVVLWHPHLMSKWKLRLLSTERWRPPRTHSVILGHASTSRAQRAGHSVAPASETEVQEQINHWHCKQLVTYVVLWHLHLITLYK